MAEKQNKTAFVRSLPESYTVDEVLAALTKAGYTKTSRQTAFSLRHTAKLQKKAGAKPNGHGEPPSAKPGKSEFIRAQPLTMGSLEVTAKAHAAGYTDVTPDSVRRARHKAGLRMGKPGRHAAKAPLAQTADVSPPEHKEILVPIVPIEANMPVTVPAPQSPPPLPTPPPAPEPLPAAVHRDAAEWRRLFVQCVCEIGITQATRLLTETEEIITSAALEGIGSDE
jgi:hypothetical protein